MRIKLPRYCIKWDGDMKKQKLKKIKELIQKILEKSYQDCKYRDENVAQNARDINKSAYECLKALEYEPEEPDDVKS